MNTSTMQAHLNTAIQAARQAGNYLLRMMDDIKKLHIEEKSPYDFVTQADKNAERIIINAIHKLYPDHKILTEESGEVGPVESESSESTQQADSDYTWIIDPLDGTLNFTHGYPHFSVSIALQHKEQVECGVVYSPTDDALFTAIRGQSAQLNNRRLRLPATKNPKQSLIAFGLPVRERQDFPAHQKAFEQVFNTYQDIRITGSAALDLANIAAGKLDGCIVSGLSPWDMAAGVLLVQEAGGLACDFEGGQDYLKTGRIIAGHKKIINSLCQITQSTGMSASHVA